MVVSGFVAGADGRVAGVECGEGEAHAADAVIVGIGLIANDALAEEAGLVVDGGIVVDGEGRTADPHIHAIGDCATHAHHGFLERKLRLESVPNALEGARAVASAIMGLAPPPAAPPWFWSDQYKLKLQMVGISDGYEAVAMRGTPESQSFVAFYMKDGKVIAADAVNRPAEFMTAKRLVGERRAALPMVLADETVPLKAALALSV